MNSVRYCQLLEFLTLSLSPNLVIPSSGGRLRAAELASSGSMPFTLGMGEDSSILTAKLSGWANLLFPLLVWDSSCLGVWVKPVQFSSGITISDDPVGFTLGSELGSPLGDLLYYETWTPVGLQLIVEISPGSKIRYPDLVGPPSRVTLAVLPLEYFPKFSQTPSGLWITSPSWYTLDVTLSGALPTLPWLIWFIWNCRECKGNNTVENKLKGLVVLCIFVVSTLSFLRVIEFSNVVLTLPLWDLINFLNNGSFLSTNFSSSVLRIITYLSEALHYWGISEILAVWIGTLFHSCLDLEIRLPTLCILSINL